MLKRWVVLVMLSGSLAACTTPRPPLPSEDEFQPPPEAHFRERPDAIQFDRRFRYDPTRFVPPEYRETLPGSHSISPRTAAGVSDAYVYFVIETDGSVRQVKLIIKTGQPETDEAIEQDIKRWRFSPATMDGHPVPVATGTIYRLRVKKGG